MLLVCGVLVVVVGGLWCWLVGLVFENCIVDASIFGVLDDVVLCLLWCKLLRAHGGCLGIRGR